jgi:hypothetical protein
MAILIILLRPQFVQTRKGVQLGGAYAMDDRYALNSLYALVSSYA